MSRKPPPFFTFFNFSSDVYNKFHIGQSRKYYPEDITHDDDQLSTKPIRRKRLKIMKMKVSWKQKKILRKERVYSKTTCVIFYI